ncbi:hypothetical protein JHK84_034520 [Glycine max]|nr:hypothetical protein JHK87_034112 [Glycine soja]KAG4986558.1 hypothetical protein JHK86_034249 [Glycine max]KAG5140752.1 hypothetical protein JHK84_034520 [Glycine max]
MRKMEMGECLRTSFWRRRESLRSRCTKELEGLSKDAISVGFETRFGLKQDSRTRPLP